jgi:hypothetical protein
MCVVTLKDLMLDEPRILGYSQVSSSVNYVHDISLDRSMRFRLSGKR